MPPTPFRAISSSTGSPPFYTARRRLLRSTILPSLSSPVPPGIRQSLKLHSSTPSVFYFITGFVLLALVEDRISYQLSSHRKGSGVLSRTMKGRTFLVRSDEEETIRQCKAELLQQMSDYYRDKDKYRITLDDTLPGNRTESREGEEAVEAAVALYKVERKGALWGHQNIVALGLYVHENESVEVQRKRLEYFARFKQDAGEFVQWPVPTFRCLPVGTGLSPPCLVVAGKLERVVKTDSYVLAKK